MLHNDQHVRSQRWLSMHISMSTSPTAGEVDKSVADYEIGEMKNHWLLMWHIIVSKLPGSYSSYDARLAAGEAIRWGRQVL